MSGPSFAEVAADLDRIAEALDAAAAGDASALDAARDGILRTLRHLDAAQTELAELRERLKRLAERYRGLRPARERGAGLEPVRALRADALGASTYVEKGWHYLALGDTDVAVQALRRALELDPQDVTALALLGWAQMRRGEDDEALRTFQEVLVRDPNHALARVHLGAVCLRKGIFGEAIEHLARVARTATDRKAVLYARYYLGLVYLEREMYRDAESFFESALDLSPHLGEAHFDLGRARFLAGDRAGAIAAWRRGAEQLRYSEWGRRCAEAAERAEAGEPTPFGR